jgi:hypothetical protein
MRGWLRVTPGRTVTVLLGPLGPGEYKFFGDFHQDTAQGVLTAKLPEWRLN